MQRKTISVTGMSCNGCEQTVGNALKTIDGVTRVDADHEGDTVEIVVEETDRRRPPRRHRAGRLRRSGLIGRRWIFPARIAPLDGEVGIDALAREELPAKAVCEHSRD